MNRQKMNEDGLCPIMGRITIDGKVCQYATQMRVSLPCWDVKSGRAYAPPRREAEARAAEAINRRLDYFVRHGAVVLFLSHCVCSRIHLFPLSDIRKYRKHFEYKGLYRH